MGARRSEILDIAKELFAERGYAATSVRDIADAAGIRAASLYSHFDSKAELLSLLLEPFVAAITAVQADALAGPGPGSARLRAMVEQVMGVCAAHPEEMSILHYNWPQIRATPELEPLVEATAAVLKGWRSAIERGRRDRSLRRDVNPDTAARLVTGALQGLVDHERYTAAGELTPRRSVASLTSDLARVLIDGLSSAPVAAAS